MLVIPLLPLKAIKYWDGNTAYDVLILAAAPADTGDAARNGKTAAEIYQAILCQFDWAAFDDENNDSAGTCSPKEVRSAFSVLGNFVEAMAHSLISEIPQTLIKQATKRDSVNSGEKIKKKNNKKQYNKKPPASAPMATLAEGEEVDGESLNSENTTKPL